MKHIPILFSTPMVQAILEGRKTMTRRIIKQIPNEVSRVYAFTDKGKHFWKEGINGVVEFGFRCPYGQPGDILWVREKWKLVAWNYDDGEMTVEYADGFRQECEIDDDKTRWLLDQVEQLVFNDYYQPVSDEPTDEEEEMLKRTDKPQPFKPSIHMPKEACRTFLKVTNIRVERLQDISDQDAIAEGILHDEIGFKDYMADASGYGHPEHDYPHVQYAQISFKTLWQSINGPASWDANPWVWVVEFERTEKPHNF